MSALDWDKHPHLSSIRVHTSFIGLHHYPLAPNQVSDLQHEHRHVFHVRVKISVDHDDREIEFFICKNDVDEVIASSYSREAGCYRLGAQSCEMIAKKIYEGLNEKYNLINRHVTIAVSEDDNNEGILEVPFS